MIIEVVADLCGRIESAGAPVVVGGSLAAGMWGDPRQTNDVDLEVWLSASALGNVIEACRAPYHVSSQEVEEALRSSDEFRIFQILEMEEVLKFDCFLQEASGVDEESLRMAKPVEFAPNRFVKVACPERIVVQKLRWYELGRRVSERQWRDLLGIARVTQLDWQLANRWATSYGLEELASLLRGEASRT